MAIGDLLAHISGERPMLAPSRLADLPPPPISQPQQQPITPSLLSLQRPLGSGSSKQAARLPKSLHQVSTGRITKPSGNGRGPLVLPPTPASPKEPQKGSYAEILDRARRVQAVMGQVGKIQHKPVERLPAMKRSLDDSKSSQQSLPSASFLSSRLRRTGGKSPLKLGRKKAVPEEKPVKKIKKAATATLGYTGTARPKPDAKAKNSAAPANLAFLQPRQNRPRESARRSQRPPQEYDEDMDDFIDYDDDQEDHRPIGSRASAPRRYESDDSDMEAGQEDIEAEERRARSIAIDEDRREEELERKLKIAKLSRIRRSV